MMQKSAANKQMVMTQSPSKISHKGKEATEIWSPKDITHLK
jgi:hypothetical protein